MGFFSRIANFGSKILGGVKKAAQWVAPALHKVLSTISGPVSMLHPAIGGALGAGANLAVRQLITNDIAYYIQYQKRGNSSGGMMSNEDGDIVPDQVTPASDATPLSDGTVTAGISTEYSRGDHVHPLNITTTIPISDSASGSVGTTNYYARNDHSHPLNITTSIPPQDSAGGSVGTTNYYARNDHSHSINVETNASNIPIVNGVGANGSSAFYVRQDHVHPQQLTYDGNVTATKFIKTGGLATELLCANGDTTAISTIDSDYVKKTGKPLQTIQGYLRKSEYQYTDEENSEDSDDDDYQTRGQIYSQYADGTPFYINQMPSNLSSQFSQSKLVKNYVLNAGSSSFAGVACGAVQINPTTANYSQGLRISRSTAGCGIYLGTDQQTSGTVQNWWQIVSQPDNFDQNPLGLTIGLSSESGAANRGLRISADGNTLSFNGSVIAGVGAINGATNGSVNYSAGNPILWGLNSVDTNGGFYSDGPKVYWRAKPVTLGAVPP
ncbi:MAG: hypothetical protein EZS28_027030 [Streblomastix strix]|uniref:Uncharacterized protein n=1 Tax=Streblomastix strix TaxID=222440 RepID=A0A5J4V4H9_9EUKA|nr:MAG: hypothetical protein EZS28_027030 [Streblomastix strix]